MPDVLWIDDDGPDRFRYEERILGRNGWSVTWASSGEKARELLSTRAFQAVILDQMLPWKSGRPGAPLPVWAGCLLLAWLRGRAVPALAPPISGFEDLWNYEPLAENTTVKIVLVSAFQDDEVEAELRTIDPDLPHLVKPIESSELVERLR